MHDYESIYQPHYEGETYRFGVAYLIDPMTDLTVTHRLSIPSLEEQRRRVAALAIEHRCIVVAEFVESDVVGTIRDRDGFWELTEMIRATHPAVLIHPGEDYLNLDSGQREHLIREAARHGAGVMSAFGS